MITSKYNLKYAKDLLNSLNVIFFAFARFRTALTARKSVALSDRNDPANITKAYTKTINIVNCYTLYKLSTI